MMSSIAPIPVSFQSNGLKLSAHIYLPTNTSLQHDNKFPALVMVHPFTGVKEQVATLYAKRFVEKGFVAIVYDSAYQGESDGLPRYLESPFQRTEDIKSAVSYLTTRPEVDAKRIGVLGICAGGGYAPYAAQSDTRIRAVATISGGDLRDGFEHGLGRQQDPAIWAGMLQTAGQLRTAEASGAEPMCVPTFPETIDEKTAVFTKEGIDYYRTNRGKHERAPGKWVFRCIDLIAQYDPYGRMAAISPRPVLMIIGSKADTAYWSREAIEKAKEPKELYVIDGATHFDLYDREPYITSAISKLNDFYTKNLA